jgi:hypothetical protein
LLAHAEAKDTERERFVALNPWHKPAGSPDGGQFDSSPERRLGFDPVSSWFEDPAPPRPTPRIPKKRIAPPASLQHALDAVREMDYESPAVSANDSTVTTQAQAGSNLSSDRWDYAPNHPISSGLPLPARPESSVGFDREDKHSIKPDAGMTPTESRYNSIVTRTPKSMHQQITTAAAEHPGDPVRPYTRADGLKYKLFDHDSVWPYKDYFVQNMRDTIKAAAAMFDVPPELQNAKTSGK